ncbi:MAG: hypothetical protein ACYTEZ_04405 [Planctomycetota bacterium]|jgi:hypothetical protein
MSDWLKALLGVEEADIPADAVTSFEFANLPRGAVGLAFLLLALALVAGVFWVYRREGSAPRGVKVGLGVLRALVIVCAFVVILEPVLAVDQVERVDKSTLLLIDASLSMTAKDRYRDPVARAELSNALDQDPSRLLRYRLVNEALEKIGFPALLAKQNQVIVYPFSSGIHAPATLPRLEEGEPPPPPVEIDLRDPQARTRGAKGTNLAGSVRQAVEAVGSDRVAAIILISDGRNNLGPPAADLALFLRNKDLRLHTVVVGEAELPRNLRAIALAGPDRIYRNDPVIFEARVNGRGYGGATVDLERRHTDGTEEWARIGSEVVAFAEEQPVVLKFTDRPPRVGTVEYRISVERQNDESNPNDNTKSFVTQVVEEKAEVLLISGAPAHDYYAVKNVLLRDTTVTLACYLQSAAPEFPQDGNVSLADLPRDEKELFKYDVVMLHDPSPNDLPPDWTALLKKFVAEHGGGVCFIAGNKHTLSLLRATTGENDITGLLPVVLDLDRADMPGIGIGYGAYFSSPWRMIPEPAALTHPATRFHSDPKRARDLVWERLPPFYWFFPVLKAKPGAVVLARHEDPRETVEPYGRRPVLAVHRYGAGRVMFLAADETHRWRSVAEVVFDRFWVQTTRFLLEGRHAGARRRFRIYTDRELVDLGDGVRIAAEVYDERFEPLEAEAVAVLLKGPGGLEEEVALLPIEGKPGHFGGSFAPPAVGDYELRPAAEEYRPKRGPDAAAATFRAEEPHREMGDVRADRGLMKDLAGRTRGLATKLHELLRVADPKLIPPASERVVTQGRPIPLWDTWTTIIVMLVLLCAEWIFRKRSRMV